MIFGPKRLKEKKIKISEEEFAKEYRPLLVNMCRDCISKAKSLQSKYKMLEDIEYVRKNLGYDEIEEPAKLDVYIFEQGYSYFFVTIIDGSQDGRCTDAAQKYLQEVRNYLYNKYKSKFTREDNELITIGTGDGDEGTIYIEFNGKNLSFSPYKIKYTPIKECVTIFDNLKIV